MRTLVWLGLAMILLSYSLVAAKPKVTQTVATGRPLVVIDPGHGGVDPGAVSHTGIQEKAINLAVSWVTANRLQAAGIAVALTRQGDHPALRAKRFVVVDDLHYRAWMTRHLGATLFLTIHTNSEPTGTAFGPIIYYVAGRPASYQLARALSSGFTQVFGRSADIRPIRQTVLLEAGVPAANVELGFLTHRQDTAKLISPSYQRALGSAISRGVIRYLGYG